MNTKQIIDSLKSNFDLSDDLEIITATGGFLTENKFVDDKKTGKKYFLKQHRDEIAKDINRIEETEKFFQKAGLPVIMPIQTKSGSYHFLYNETVCTLYPFVVGIHHKRGDLSDAVLATLGRTLAKIHKASANGLPENIKYEQKEFWSEERFFEKAEKVRKIISVKREAGEGLSDFDNLTLDILALKEKLILDNKITYDSLGFVADTVTHGDFHDQNVFFDENGNVSGIFDFEKSVVGPREIELVRSMMLVCFAHSSESDFLNNASIYLNAYQNEYKLPADRFTAAVQAHFLKGIHSTWVEGEHYLRGNTKVHLFLAGYKNTIEYMLENMEKINSLV